jgi:acylphosphatase
VRNRHDGTVELWLEGSRELVDRMIELCHDGPPAAAVDHVAIEWSTPSGCREFRVTR